MLQNCSCIFFCAAVSSLLLSLLSHLSLLCLTMATEPPKKKGRPGFVPDDHRCARCLLCDGIGKFASTMRHPKDDCTIFFEYASAHSNVSFVVEPDSCICSACFMAFNRFFVKSGSDRASHSPMVEIKDENPTVHCFMSVPSLAMPSSADNGMANDGTAACVCNVIDLWAPVRWYDREGLDFWVSFLQYLGFSFSCSNLSICKKHYTYLRKCLGDSKCVYCDMKWSESLSIGNTFVSNMQVSHPQHYKTLIEMLDGEHPLCHSWVYGECCCVIKNELSLSSLLHEKGSSNDPFLQCRNDVVKEMISVLSNDGILLNTEFKQIYRAKIFKFGWCGNS